MAVNGEKLVTFMCTPKDLGDLAAGHLYTRGLIKGMEDVNGIAACHDMKMISAFIKGDIKDELLTIPKVILSGCGSGSLFDKKLLEREKLDFSGFTIPLEEIKIAFKEMAGNAPMYKTMGGVHCASIKHPAFIPSVREDIGRHNAVDKAVGAAIKAGIPLSKSIALTTGRLSLDMVLKAAAGKIPVVASLSIPSDLAIQLADHLGICLIGRIGSPSPIVYNFKERII